MTKGQLDMLARCLSNKIYIVLYDDLPVRRLSDGLVMVGLKEDKIYRLEDMDFKNFRLFQEKDLTYE